MGLPKWRPRGHDRGERGEPPAAGGKPSAAWGRGDPEGGHNFLRRGLRPPQRMIVAFIDEQRSPDGSERPCCIAGHLAEIRPIPPSASNTMSGSA